MNLSRKEFLKKTAILSSGLIILPAVGELTGCSAAGEFLKVAVSPKGIIKYDVTNSLKKPGEAVLLEPDKTDSRVLLIRKKDSTFITLSLVCTHRGCELSKRRDYLECPCHGSEFNFDGNVIKGPAGKSLRSFMTEFDGKNTVTIFLE